MEWKLVVGKKVKRDFTDAWKTKYHWVKCLFMECECCETYKEHGIWGYGNGYASIQVYFHPCKVKCS